MACIKNWSKITFFLSYLCRAWEDSCDFTLDMLKCNTTNNNNNNNTTLFQTAMGP